MIVDELIAVLGYRLTGAGDLARFNQGIKGAERNLAAFAAAAGRYARIASAAVAAAGGVFVNSVIKTNAQFEKFHATLEILEGSSAAADKSFAWIKEFAKTTPFEVETVTAAFVKLRSYGIDPTNGTLRSVGDAASAMGKTLNEGVEALADAATNEFERLKEFGVTAAVEGDNVAFSWQENGKTVTKSVKKNGQEISAFLVGNFNRFRGAMDKQSRTWNGLVSNLSDTWTEFLSTVGQAGFFDFAKDQLEGLKNWADRMAADGSLARWAKNVSNAMIGVAKVVGFLADRVMKDGQVFIEWMNKADPKVFYAIAAAFGLLMIYLFPVTFALTAIVVALDDIAEWMRGGESRFGDLIKWIEQLTGVSNGLATALAAIVASLGLIASIKVFSILGALGKFVKGFGAGVAGEIAGGAKGAGPRSGGLMGAFKGGIGTWLSAAVAAASLNWGLSDTSKFQSEIDRMNAAKAGIKERFPLPADKPPSVGKQIRSMLDAPRAETTGGPARYRSQPRETLHPSLMNDNLQPAGARAAEVNAGGGVFASMLANMNANLAKMTQGAAAGATITDARQDNRSFPISVNAPTTVNVTQAAQAAAAAVGAVGAAVGEAAAQQATRIQQGPAMP